MKSFKALITLLVISGAITGCSGLSPEDAKNRQSGAAAAFSTTPVEATASQLVADGPAGWNLLFSRVVTLKTCIKDSALLQSLAGTSFDLTNATSTLTVVSDANGCVYWQENVPFHYLSDETYFEYTRTLTPSKNDSTIAGSTELRFGINPWQDSKSAVVDLAMNAPSQLRSALTSATYVGSSTGFSKLRMKKSQLEITSVGVKGNEVSLAAKLELQLETVRKGISQAEIKEELQKGIFNVGIKILDDEEVLGNTHEAAVTIQDGILQIKPELTIKRPVDDFKTLKISVSLDPVVTPFLGTVLLELAVTPQQLRTGQIFSFTQSFDKTVSLNNSDGKTNLTPKSTPENFRSFEQGSSKISLKKVSYRFRGNRVISVSPRYDLVLGQRYEFFFDPTIFRPKELGGQTLDSYLPLQNGSYQIKMLMLFPLSPKDESRLLDEPEITDELASLAALHGQGECFATARIGLLCPFSFELLASEGRITVPLEMIYRMEDVHFLQARAKLFIELTGNESYLKFQPAQVQMPFIAVTDESSPLMDTVNSPKEVEKSSQIVTAIPAHNEYLYKKNAALAVQHSEYEWFGKISSESVQSIIPDEEGRNEWIARWFAYYDVSSRGEFGKLFNEDKINAEWVPHVNDPTLKNAGKLFCDLFYPKTYGLPFKDTEYEKCLKAPENKIAFIPMKYLESVEKILRGRDGEPKPIDLNTSFFRERGEAIRKVIGTKEYGRVEIGKLPVLELVGIGGEFGTEGYLLQEAESKDATRDRAQIALQLKRKLVEWKVTLAGKTRRCVWVAKRPLRLPLNEGVQICESSNHAETLNETWYYLGVDMNVYKGTPSDGRNLESNDSFKIIRGATAFSRTLKIFQSKVGVLIDRLDQSHLSNIFGPAAAWNFLKEMTVIGGAGLGTTAIEHIDTLNPTGEEVRTDLVRFFLDNSVPGMVDSPREWSGARLIQYYSEN